MGVRQKHEGPALLCYTRQGGQAVRVCLGLICTCSSSTIRATCASRDKFGNGCSRAELASSAVPAARTRLVNWVAKALQEQSTPTAVSYHAVFGM